jgi:hypothetical protein
LYSARRAETAGNPAAQKKCDCRRHPSIRDSLVSAPCTSATLAPWCGAWRLQLRLPSSASSPSLECNYHAIISETALGHCAPPDAARALTHARGMLLTPAAGLPAKAESNCRGILRNSWSLGTTHRPRFPALLNSGKSGTWACLSPDCDDARHRRPHVVPLLSPLVA